MFAQSLKNNDTIKHLKLGDNCITNDFIKVINDKLEKNQAKFEINNYPKLQKEREQYSNDLFQQKTSKLVQQRVRQEAYHKDIVTCVFKWKENQKEGQELKALVREKDDQEESYKYRLEYMDKNEGALLKKDTQKMEEETAKKFKKKEEVLQRKLENLDDRADDNEEALSIYMEKVDEKKEIHES